MHFGFCIQGDGAIVHGHRGVFLDLTGFISGTHIGVHHNRGAVSAYGSAFPHPNGTCDDDFMVEHRVSPSAVLCYNLCY